MNGAAGEAAVDIIVDNEVTIQNRLLLLWGHSLFEVGLELDVSLVEGQRLELDQQQARKTAFPAPTVNGKVRSPCFSLGPRPWMVLSNPSQGALFPLQRLSL